MKLASDLDNREFAGASNPDDQLWVRFDSRKHLLAFKSEQEGHPVYEMRDYITIQIPGNPNLTIEREVIPGDKARFPRHWAHYQNNKGGELIEGWALETWPMVNAAQVEELKYRKCHTVEQLAGMPDSMVQIMGMGYQELKNKAIIAMKHARDGAEAIKFDAEMKKRDEKIAAQDAEMAEMREQLNKLMQQSKAGKPAKAEPDKATA